MSEEEGRMSSNVIVLGTSAEREGMDDPTPDVRRESGPPLIPHSVDQNPPMGVPPVPPGEWEENHTPRSNGAESTTAPVSPFSGPVVQPAEMPARIRALARECVVDVACSGQHALALTRLCGDGDPRWDVGEDLEDQIGTPTSRGGRGKGRLERRMVCGITGEIMHDPVYVKGYGKHYTFEREAITAWLAVEEKRLQGRGVNCIPQAFLAEGPGPVCPLTGEVLPQEQNGGSGSVKLVSLTELQTDIALWQHDYWARHGQLNNPSLISPNPNPGSYWRLGHRSPMLTPTISGMPDSPAESPVVTGVWNVPERLVDLNLPMPTYASLAHSSIDSPRS